MITNGTIEAIRTFTATRGDGEFVFAASTIVVPIPCQHIEPSSYRRETDRQRGIELKSIILVNRAAVEAQGHTMAIGDRVSSKKNRLDPEAMVADVIEIREKFNGLILEIALGERVDDAVLGGSS